MSGRVAEKTAIVVGAGSIGPGWGNGKASAVLLAREGAKVLCVDANAGAAEETAALIAGEGGEGAAGGGGGGGGGGVGGAAGRAGGAAEGKGAQRSGGRGSGGGGDGG